MARVSGVDSPSAISAAVDQTHERSDPMLGERFMPSMTMTKHQFAAVRSAKIERKMLSMMPRLTVVIGADFVGFVPAHD